MDTIVNVAFPVFAIIGLGYAAGHLRILGPASAEALNKFVYYFALPPVLFVFTAKAPVDVIFNWPFIGTFLAGAIGTLAVSAFVGRLMFRLPLSELTLQGLAAVFANTAYMGIPLFLTAFGDDGALPAIIATLAGNFILIGGAIAVLEKLRAKGPSTLDICREVSGTLIRNPLLVAPILGILFSVFALPLPLPVGNFLDLMAAAAGPAALFALGLSLVGQSLLGNMREVAWVSGLKLFLQPALTLFFALYVFDLGERLTAAAVILGALPAGALVYVIAQQYGIYVQRASASIVLTTAISIASVSGLLILFGVG